MILSPESFAAGLGLGIPVGWLLNLLIGDLARWMLRRRGG